MSQGLSNILKLLAFILVASMLFLASHYSGKESDRKVTEIRNEYPVIGTTKKDYNGIIDSCTIGNQYINGKGIYVKIRNGSKFVIPGNTYNSQYKKKDLRDNLQVNDSIYYDYKTNEFYIYRKGQTFYFKLWHEI